MEISGSAFSSGLSTVQSGQRRIDQAASDIASNSVNRNSDAADTADNLVQLNVGKVEAQAGAKVIETSDEVLGTLIDIRA
jgi:flagellar hook protein FlgE